MAVLLERIAEVEGREELAVSCVDGVDSDGCNFDIDIMHLVAVR